MSQDIPLVEIHPSKGQLDRVPLPSHRHASPFAPWPWIDPHDEIDPKQLETVEPPASELCDHSSKRCNGCWKGYPQSLFQNWTQGQVKKAKIYNLIHNYSKIKPCVYYRADVNDRGLIFHTREITTVYGDEDIIWDNLVHEHRPSDTRLRAFFIENLSGPMLQMLGTKYNIEPLFWSSSLNWIPSGYQEEIKNKVGDHITITLTFLCSMSDSDAIQLVANRSRTSVYDAMLFDVHAPLILHSNKRLLVLDLLSVHLVRNINGSTIISYHPTLNFPATTAESLHERLRSVGQSVYWQSMFQKSQDPTLILLTFIWHTMYAWDEALENLYEHICSLEDRVMSTAEMTITRELHIIRAHHLHYKSLLDHCTKHINFIKNTPNPALDGVCEVDRKKIAKLLMRECDNLLNEIERLNNELSTQGRRLKTVMDLVFASVTITNSQYMRDMATAVVRDNAAIQQILYLTMIFLPSSFAVSVFSMNVVEINPQGGTNLSQYVALALSLTVVTFWITIALQSIYRFPRGTSFYKRLGWPIFFVIRVISPRKHLVGQFQDQLRPAEHG